MADHEYYVVDFMTPKPNRFHEILDLLSPLVAEAHNQPGILQYDVREADHATRIVIVARWKTYNDFTTWLQNPILQESQLQHLLARPIERVVLTPLPVQWPCTK